MIPTPLLACDRRPSASETEISAAERDLGLMVPPDYKAFLREANGVEGFVAPEAYLILWSVSDLHSLNAAYAVSEFLAGVTLIGTDGGDTGYGFRFREEQVEYVSTPLVGMEPAALKVMGASLNELVARIATLAA
jgi:hypothetical protein